MAAPMRRDPTLARLLREQDAGRNHDPFNPRSAPFAQLPFDVP